MASMPAVNSVIARAVRSGGRGTQARLAQELGVKAQTVSKWVSGEVMPGRDKWERIEEVLGLEPGVLLQADLESQFDEHLDPSTRSRIRVSRERLNEQVHQLGGLPCPR